MHSYRSRLPHRAQSVYPSKAITVSVTSWRDQVKQTSRHSPADRHTWTMATDGRRERNRFLPPLRLPIAMRQQHRHHQLSANRSPNPPIPAAPDSGLTVTRSLKARNGRTNLETQHQRLPDLQPKKSLCSVKPPLLAHQVVQFGPATTHSNARRLARQRR